jgi:hypothetical protein
MIITPADFFASASSNVSCSHCRSAAFLASYSASSPLGSLGAGSVAEPLPQRLLPS